MALGDFIGGIAGGATVAVVIKAVDEFSSTINSAESALSKLGKLSIGAAVTGVTALAAGVTALGVSSVQTAVEFEAVQNRLTKILQTSRGASKEQIAVLFEQAKALEQLGVVSQTNVIATQSQLATFDLEVDSIKTLTPAILDYVVAEKGANASTEEFKALTNGLAQALNGQFQSLTRTGFVLDEATKELISTGSETEKVQAIVKVLNSTYKDFNESAKDTSEGGLQSLNNSFQDMQRQIGNALLPVFNELLKSIQPLIPPLTQVLVKIFEMAAPLIDTFARFAIQLADIFINEWFPALEPLIPVLVELANQIGNALVEAVIQLTPAMVDLVPVAVEFLKTIIPFIPVLAQIIASLLSLAATFLQELAPVFLKANEYFKPVLGAFREMIDLIRAAIDWVERLSDKLTSAFKKSLGFSAKTTKVNDFILQPGGKLIETDPQDTIIGMKNPNMGSEVNISIENVYGVNPEELSKALKQELSSKLSI